MKKVIRDLRGWWFHKKLNWIACFLEKHRLYPVTLDEKLLQIWKGKAPN